MITRSTKYLTTRRRFWLDCLGKQWLVTIYPEGRIGVKEYKKHKSTERLFDTKDIIVMALEKGRVREPNS
jgi:ArsR family metal-binding transcriptional regulator